MQEIKKKTATGFIWRLAERTLAQLVAFVVSVILARILDPSAYGSITLITVFTAIMQVFVDSGLGNSLIQKKDADDLDFSTVFYTNVIFCIIIYMFIFLLSPVIARFYKDDSLTPYIRVLGLTVLISGVKNVQQAYVSRNMMFRKFFFSTLAGTIVAGVAGVLMALNGAGLWALVFQQVINLAIDTIVLWLTVGWRPVKAFSFSRLKKLYGYGWKLLVSALLDTGYTKLRQLLIGKVYSPSDLAYYDQGEKLPSLAINNINLSISSVLFPALSNEQDDRVKLKNMTRRSIQVSIYIIAPMMMGLFAVAEPLVRLIWTEKWLPAVFYMRIFCISFMFYPIHAANLSAITALGRSDLFLKLEIIKKAVGLALIIITVNISIKAMAYSILISTVTGQIINSWPNKKLLNYGYLEQIKDILPIIVLSVFMGGCVYLITLIGFVDIVTIVMQILTGVLLYISLSAIFKIDSFIYLMEVFKIKRK